MRASQLKKPVQGILVAAKAQSAAHGTPIRRITKKKAHNEAKRRYKAPSGDAARQQYMAWLGKSVFHQRYGWGKVVEIWGTFQSCHACFMPHPKTHNVAHEVRRKEALVRTNCCNSYVMSIPGAGVFDVYFPTSNETHSINVRWLKRKYKTIVKHVKSK